MYKILFLNHQYLYFEIAIEMRYVDVDGPTAEKKFRSLVQTYKKVKYEKNKSGSGQVTWQWYEVFEDLFQWDVVHNPVGIIEYGATERRDVPTGSVEEEAADDGPSRRRNNNEEYRLELEERRLAATERMLTLMESYY